MKSPKKIWNAFTLLLVALIVLLTILLVGVRLIGLRPLAVLSGSMEPDYPVGSLIYVKRADHTRLDVGDVITFMLDENTLATHRIVEILPDETDPSVLRFRTKGDANNAADGSLVHYKNIVGTPIITVPRLGYLANYIQTPPGTYIAISAGAILLILVFLPDLFGSDKSEKKKPQKAAENNADTSDKI